MSTPHDQLVALAGWLAGQRESVLAAWRSKLAADPQLTSGAALPRAQLHDHLPALLEDFEHRLVASGARSRAASLDEQHSDAAAHGLHRWQQGFDLSEVTRELGRFNECVVAALDRVDTEALHIQQPALAEARSIWAALYSVVLGSSTAQYFQLQQLEAAGHVADLETALETMQQLEVQRAELWQQAAHDLRGNLGVVAMATAGLASDRAPLATRQRFLGALDRNVRALHRLLEDVTSLARLQGGQEVRMLAAVDASSLLREIAEGLQTAADERRLSLRFDGPQVFHVQGDAVKIGRIVQNLVLNAIKYTLVGGVTVNWGALAAGDAERWFISVTDTGPGLQTGHSAPLVRALDAATDQALQVAAQHEGGSAPHVTVAASKALLQPVAPAARGITQAHEGEGIGLSIVKRLCTLLDATLEVESGPVQGTSFRILLPQRYGVVTEAPAGF